MHVLSSLTLIIGNKEEAVYVQEVAENSSVKLLLKIYKRHIGAVSGVLWLSENQIAQIDKLPHRTSNYLALYPQWK